MTYYHRNTKLIIVIALIITMIFIVAPNKEKASNTTISTNNSIANTENSASNSFVTPSEANEPWDSIEKPKEALDDSVANGDAECAVIVEDEINPKESKNSTSKKMIAIDAGHQSKGNNDKEPMGPGSNITKAKVSSGTQGVSSGIPEYELNLIIAQKVAKELRHRGYDIFMIRTTNEVNLSNKERADMANESGADLFIRIHADSSTDPDVSGTSTLYPSENNPYVSILSKDSYALSQAIVNSICSATDSKNRGAIARDDMSGINWCTIPVTIIEMGFLSNKREDKLLQTENYQDKIVQGICDGIEEYYK